MRVRDAQCQIGNQSAPANHCHGHRKSENPGTTRRPGNRPFPPTKPMLLSVALTVRGTAEQPARPTTSAGTSEPTAIAAPGTRAATARSRLRRGRTRHGTARWMDAANRWTGGAEGEADGSVALRLMRRWQRSVPCGVPPRRAGGGSATAPNSVPWRKRTTLSSYSFTIRQCYLVVSVHLLIYYYPIKKCITGVSDGDDSPGSLSCGGAGWTI